MKKFFCAIFLIVIAQAAKEFRLSTLGFKQLTPNDTIVSTLGHFSIKLLTTGCTLSIQNFDPDTEKYVEKGKYTSSQFTGNCQYLNITEGKIVTDNGSNYLTVINVSFNYSTIFTIDDEGIMRLIGTFISPNRVDIVSEQTVISDFKTDNKYVKAFSEYEVSFANRYEAFSNERKWKFIAEFGQLTIYYGEDPGKKVDYVYSSISIRDSRIYDFANRTFPAILFNNITFPPRCSEPRVYLDFKPPFVFVADPYWPIVSVYEQGGYRIIQVAYFKLPQYDFAQDITEINFHHFPSPCPRRTFEHKGDCIASCPSPYYHQIKGETGKCVLVCQQYSIINETSRVCSCVTDYESPKLSTSDLVIKCPSNSVKTPYGCQCKKEGEFYDSILSFTCVKTCPNATYAMNGLCMQCSEHCKGCQRDNFNRLFLECIECEEGYHLFKAQCVKSCQTNYGFSQINGKCEKCEDVNCVDCSNDPKVCLKCSLLTTLSNGTCKNNCTLPAQQVYSEYFSTQCITPPTTCFEFLSSHYKSKAFLKCDFCFTGIAHLDTCVQTCPTGYYSHNGKYCACDGVKNLTIYDQCLAQKACPITMSFDIRSHSCLSCPFGCMSCINTQCTSCNPGYFLYISPQSILCRRKSPLFPCDQQYSWQRNTTCLVTNFTNPTLRMTECTGNIVNCSVCIPGSDQICVLCSVGFYIYNNTCIESCPQTMIPYDNTCILPEIQQCQVPHLQSIHQSAVITLQKIKASTPYGQYIYDNKESANDPVGYIPVFQDLSSRSNDGVPRQTEFFEVQWVCLKCKEGYGLSDNFKSCLPCPTVCSERLCYMARDDSCLTKRSDTAQTNCTENQYIDSETGECLESCNDPNKFPEIEQNKLYCKPATNSATKGYLRIDSAIYEQSDGSNMVFFVFSQKVTSINEQLPIKYLGALSKTKRGRTLQNETNQTADPNSQPSELTVQDGGYLFLNQSNFNETYNAYQLDLSDKLTKLQGVSSSEIFPNKVYGTMVDSDHPQFIKYWLAYIGYIMSIVILLLHFVFIGNQLLYKADNLLIFAQTIFYFTFARNLVGRLVSQYYYGWIFTHAGFLPNLFENTIPDYYAELEAPESFKLVNVDGNYFRNAGFSLAWLLIYLGCCLLVILVVWLLLFKTMRKKEVWYPRVAKQAVLGGVEFFSMNLIFFAVTQLQYGGNYPQNNQQYHDASVALSIVTIVVLCIYTVVRWLFHRLGALYMVKRILMAVFLALSYEKTIFLLPVILTEVGFVAMRYVLQGPYQKFNKISIFVEGLVLLLCYVLLFLSLDAGVNAIILSIVIFVFIVYLAYDLTTIYLESRDEYPQDQLIEESEAERYERASRMSGGNFSRKQSALNYGYGESAVVV